jgi:nucleoside-diphosphate-sugar epimerase
LVRVLGGEGHDVVGVDVLDAPYTNVLGSVANRSCVRTSVEGANAVLHTATLHKPHIGSHGRQAFIDTNVTGTLTLLEEAVAAGVSCFVFTSTTSAFGQALTPAADAPAAWITAQPNRTRSDRRNDHGEALVGGGASPTDQGAQESSIGIPVVRGVKSEINAVGDLPCFS